MSVRNLILVLGLLAPATVTGQSQASFASARNDPGWDAFVRTFDAYADSDRVVGASALVMRNGRIISRHDYGFADRERGQRVNDRTIFH